VKFQNIWGNLIALPCQFLQILCLSATSIIPSFLLFSLNITLFFLHRIFLFSRRPWKKRNREKKRKISYFAVSEISSKKNKLNVVVEESAFIFLSCCLENS